MSGSGTRPQTGKVLPTRTTEEVRADGADVAVLPIGSFEQHGAFLPLATDTVIACTIADEIAAAHPVLHLPPVTISCSHEHAAWPGTVSLSAATLYAVVRDIADSLRRSGVRGLILVNGHGGNYVLRNIVQESAATDFRMALFPGSADWDGARTRAGVRTPSNTDMHAGELETSILLHAHPELVRPGHETSDWISDDRKHLLTLGMPAYTESGVIGRPSEASADKGKELLAGLVESFAEYLSLVGAEKEA
ncbi:creatininase family protein [Streptomyces samsunensis]|uniref:Creatininase family protein n=2 Tax=Streptomyces TaxID=1883 RepID=A0ABX6W378_STRMQ|nr:MULTISPECIES: creatininase family protein [Streptomyces]MYU09904.1 creatininase family protein [Streptomyces sp. SID8361]AQA10984.1 creatinine amidohydrolase [Streptomyces autolyticus]ATL81814.1 putative creatinine amidohydrolase [Streptomyces malaysiensis]AUA14887.1 Creatinine amidohydrolase [Streptomyces sp. M56]MCC4320788.1 creatininase family protein [Streptomyces malaysiensis]